mmetsp:Transcript_16875/g.52414  ORF Transcript_16875/g.52414 Transcript_16875/m.52414 type:complete len:428 (-) Transcript_16875:13-1296(-)
MGDDVGEAELSQDEVRVLHLERDEQLHAHLERVARRHGLVVDLVGRRARVVALALEARLLGREDACLQPHVEEAQDGVVRVVDGREAVDKLNLAVVLDHGALEVAVDARADAVDRPVLDDLGLRVGEALELERGVVEEVRLFTEFQQQRLRADPAQRDGPRRDAQEVQRPVVDVVVALLGAAGVLEQRRVEHVRLHAVRQQQRLRVRGHLGELPDADADDAQVAVLDRLAHLIDDEPVRAALGAEQRVVDDVGALSEQVRRVAGPHLADGGLGDVHDVAPEVADEGLILLVDAVLAADIRHLGVPRRQVQGEALAGARAQLAHAVPVRDDEAARVDALARAGAGVDDDRVVLVVDVERLDDGVAQLVAAQVVVLGAHDDVFPRLLAAHLADALLEARRLHVRDQRRVRRGGRGLRWRRRHGAFGVWQ